MYISESYTEFDWGSASSSVVVFGRFELPTSGRVLPLARVHALFGRFGLVPLLVRTLVRARALALLLLFVGALLLLRKRKFNLYRHFTFVKYNNHFTINPSVQALMLHVCYRNNNVGITSCVVTCSRLPHEQRQHTTSTSNILIERSFLWFFRIGFVKCQNSVQILLKEKSFFVPQIHYQVQYLEVIKIILPFDKNVLCDVN